MNPRIRSTGQGFGIQLPSITRFCLAATRNVAADACGLDFFAVAAALVGTVFRVSRGSAPVFFAAGRWVAFGAGLAAAARFRSDVLVFTSHSSCSGESFLHPSIKILDRQAKYWTLPAANPQPVYIVYYIFSILHQAP